MNGFKLNLRGVKVKARDLLLPANGESRVAFQRTTEPDPDVSLMFRLTCMQGIISHWSRGTMIPCRVMLDAESRQHQKKLWIRIKTSDSALSEEPPLSFMGTREQNKNKTTKKKKKKSCVVEKFRSGQREQQGRVSHQLNKASFCGRECEGVWLFASGIGARIVTVKSHTMSGQLSVE